MTLGKERKFMNKSDNLSHENKRIGWIDIAKGYGILLVILGHLNVGLLGKWIYTFHMPLFFFCRDMYLV